MPIHFRLYPDTWLVTYTVEGDATGGQARGFLDAVLAHPRFRRGFDFLGDFVGTRAADGAYPAALAGEVLARADCLAPCRWAVWSAGVPALQERAALARPRGVEVVPFAGWTDALLWLVRLAAGRPDPTLATATLAATALAGRGGTLTRHR